jgi:hypothetical protein
MPKRSPAFDIRENRYHPGERYSMKSLIHDMNVEVGPVESVFQGYILHVQYVQVTYFYFYEKIM